MKERFIYVFDPYFCFHQLIFIRSYFCHKFHVLKSQGVEHGSFWPKFLRVSDHISEGAQGSINIKISTSDALESWSLTNIDAIIKFRTHSLHIFAHRSCILIENLSLRGGKKYCMIPFAPKFVVDILFSKLFSKTTTKIDNNF